MRLAESQLDLSRDFPGWVVFASNPSGFVYAEDKGGVVYLYDTQALTSVPEAAQAVASDLDDFFSRYVFGPDSDTFCAGDWKELVLSKITEPKPLMPLHDGSNSAFRRVARAV